MSLWKTSVVEPGILYAVMIITIVLYPRAFAKVLPRVVFKKLIIKYPIETGRSGLWLCATLESGKKGAQLGL